MGRRNMKNRGLAIAVLTFAMFMDLMDVTIVNVALVDIKQDLSTSSAELQWVLSGYTLAFAGILITASRLGDRFGRQRVFIVGIVGFTLASLLASLAQNGETLVASRFVQGAFAGLMVPQVLASVQALYKPKERAPIFGVIGVITALAAVIGPVLGGWLITSNPLGGHWRSIFYINLPVGVIITIAAIFLVPNTKQDRPNKLDPLGVLLAIGAVLLLVYPLVEGRELGWPAWSFVLMALSPVTLAIFFWYQTKRESNAALIPVRLFGNRGFTAGLVIYMCFAASIGAFFLILALYVQGALRFEAVTSGALGLPFSLGAMVAAGIAGPLAPRLGRMLPAIGGLMMATGTAWTAYNINSAGAGYSAWDTVWPMLLAGMGLTTMMVPLLDISLSTIDHNDAGAASGVMSTFQQIGSALGIAIVGVMFFGNGGNPPSDAELARLAKLPPSQQHLFLHEGQQHALHAFNVGIWVPIVGYALCAAFAFLLPGISAVRARAEAEARAAEEEDLEATVAG